MTKKLTDEQRHLRRIEKLKRWGVVGTKKRAAIAFQKMIRLESADENGMVHCVTCEFSNHWRNSDNRMDAGHFLAGRTNAVLFCEEPPNCHPQCVTCNRYHSGRLDVYTDFMLAKYGSDAVRSLRMAQNSVIRWSAMELDEMRLGFLNRIKEAEKRLGMK